MRKLVSVYNRSMRSLNSTGPHDPTATVYLVPDTCPFPQTLVDKDAVRFLATVHGGIIHASPAVLQSISTDGHTIKALLLAHLLKNARLSTVAEITADAR